MTRSLTLVLIAFALLRISAETANAEQAYQARAELTEGTTPADAAAVSANATSTASVEKTGLADGAKPLAGDAPTKDAARAELERAPLAEFDQRAHDEVWAISSRHLDSIHCPSNSLQFNRRLQGDHWQCETSSSFFVQDPTAPPRRTVIFIHGNRTSQSEAIREGLQTYDQTFVKWQSAEAVRFVIWAWPSDKVCGQIRDVRMKAGLADEHAFHVARLLAQFPQSNVALIGFSFGGRICLSAAHLLGGGCIGDYRLAERHQVQASFDLSLVAPAIRNDCLITTRTKALERTERLFLLHNTQDQYLKLYRFLRFDNFRPGLGNTGICGIYCSDRERVQIEQYDAAQRVGSEHSYLEYLVDKRIEQRIRDNLMNRSR